jgi:aerobic-type carbon monoxide dehydrogenase small subunit (CoxS/CutS family)
MRLFLLIALVAVVAVVVLALMRGGTRITTIEHRREERKDEDGDA